jgi:hypothetical protein
MWMFLTCFAVPKAFLCVEFMRLAKSSKGKILLHLVKLMEVKHSSNTKLDCTQTAIQRNKARRIEHNVKVPQYSSITGLLQ